MIVTFITRSRVMGYRPGQVIKTELTPIIKALLIKDKHIQLIDPPSVEDLNGSHESSSNSKKRGPASGTNHRYQAATGGRVSEVGASEHPSERDGGDGGASPKRTGPSGYTAGQAYPTDFDSTARDLSLSWDEGSVR
jgi:hypothetical protein